MPRDAERETAVLRALGSPEGAQDLFRHWNLTPDEQWYLRFNLKRYRYLVPKAAELVEAVSAEPEDRRILDIGPSFQTELLRLHGPGWTVNSLGLRAYKTAPRGHERHWDFDLNDAVHFPSRRPDVPLHDVVVMAEVIEHLYTPPHRVLELVGSFVKPSGRLIVQTPNAVALHKRLQMLVGRHPYGELNSSRLDPAHCREYTRAELELAGVKAGLQCCEVHMANYFERDSLISRLYNATASLLPPRLRAGITVVYGPRHS